MLLLQSIHLKGLKGYSDKVFSFQENILDPTRLLFLSFGRGKNRRRAEVLGDLVLRAVNRMAASLVSSSFGVVVE